MARISTIVNRVEAALSVYTTYERHNAFSARVLPCANMVDRSTNVKTVDYRSASTTDVRISAMRAMDVTYVHMAV